MMFNWLKPAVGLAALAVSMACSPATPAAETPAQEAPASTAAPGAPAPALWKTGDADTTIYLFGTVHVLPPDVVWRTDRVDEALAASQAVYFETDIDPDLATLGSAVRRLGQYPPGEKLSDRLSADQRATLSQAADDLGAPMFVLDSMKPWLAAMTLGEQLIVKAGYDPASGVERTLGPVAASAGKEIRKLETIEQQLLAFADLPESAQVAYLMDGVGQIGEETEILGELVSAWVSGDVEALDRIMIDGDLGDMPDVYQAVLVKRNANWVRTLDTLAKTEPGVFFVAVGAGHLAGEDSVQNMMTDAGYEVVRVE